MRAAFKILVPMALLATSLAGAGYLHSTRPAVQPAPAIERVWTVRAEPARLADHRPVLQLYGDVVAGREVTLRPLVAGEIVEASSKLVEGGAFAIGERIIAIDPFEYQAAHDELAAEQREARARRTELQGTLQGEWTMLRLDETQLELARRDLTRREQLRGSQAASEKALDDARMTVAAHEAALAHRRQAILTLEAKLEQQDAVIRRLDVAIRRAERDLANTELRGSQAASEKALDEARMTVAAHEAALAHRRQAILTLEVKLEQQDAVIRRLDVAIRRAERDLANTELRAPFAGFVTEVTAALGKRVGIGDPIARLIDSARLEIRFTLSDTEFGRIWQDGLIGRELQAKWRLGDASFPIEGRVARVEATIDPASGGVDVYAEVTGNPESAPLRPGAFVTVLLPDRLHREVVELPASALFDGHTVYAIEDGRLQPRPVELIADLGARILVRGELAAGESIVTSRLAEIGPGLKVEAIE